MYINVHNKKFIGIEHKAEFDQCGGGVEHGTGKVAGKRVKGHLSDEMLPKSTMVIMTYL